MKTSILDRQFSKSKGEVSLSLYAFLFSEMVQYCLNNVEQSQQLEDKLHEVGVRVGYRVLDLLCYRDKANRREVRLLSMLSFVSQTCWRALFGHAGDLLKGQDSELEYMINDKSLLLTKFISVPRDFSHINCGAYAAGIVEGILQSAEFPCEASAHTVEESTNPPTRSTTVLIRFASEVVEREKRLQNS
ncbi:unnamed protein product [Vitrella brassicaformis CCMP3155]|uniref:Trafficking protein particle complex subunit n=1 Tax=Vitrella brassicaformis (strain CCMP3155) TaxID=1169540 RepID=A0A0G4FH09_VITBC|nr:unnamed protein product [Vitrella brassicaformis CCMP3155]|mmetsp:Transcript_53081/g.133597  ORF Transcript_53081/g.133597 Transcript_53081/m.133597 type:complete len:189 (-) Transcript_53081:168-734(-)|eukprot:CEM12701.1 unnamed protein product [Vitrella brassicaformis CCMP3155]